MKVKVTQIWEDYIKPRNAEILMLYILGLIFIVIGIIKILSGN